MATQIVELTGDEAKLLKSLDKVIQKQLDYERKLRDTAEQGDAAGVAVQAAFSKVQREGDQALKGLLRELKTVGPEGAGAADALQKHLRGAGKAGFRSMDEVLAQIRLIDPEAAEAAAAAAASFDNSAEVAEAAWREQLQLLRSLGPEGTEAAAQIERDMKAAAAEAAGGMQGVLAKLEEIDPTVAESANRVRRELADAAQYSEREFADVLNELRKLGPEGRQAAAELRQHLVDAGKIAERSMDGIADKLDAIDPAAAKAARGIIANMKNAGDKGESIFAKFGKSAVAQVVGVASAYVGVQEAIQLVNGYLEHQNQLLQNAADKQVSLAQAQQEAAKNLAGLSVVERNDLLRAAVPDIAAQTGFADVAEITQALGAVASAGESNAAAIKNAVLQAARVERLTPEQLDATAATASAVQRQAGLADVRQAIGLVETTGTQARIVDPTKLAKELPKAVGSAVSTVRGQDAETAARQAAALFAQITQGGNDEMGASSATFTVDFTTRMQKFFVDLENERIQARSKIDLIDRKIAKGSETEAQRQTKQELTEFLGASEGVTDPGELFARLEVLQNSPALSRQFRGEGFGEKQFQVALDDLLDGTSALSAALQQSFQTIQADVAFFEREAATLAGSTPQLSLAALNAASQGAVAAQQTGDTEGAALGKVRELVSTALRDTAPSFMANLLDFSSRGGLPGSTAAEEALSGTLELQQRIEDLQQGGVTPGEATKIRRLQSEIDALFRFVESAGGQGALDPAGLERARRRAGAGARNDTMGVFLPPETVALFQRMVDVMERIDESNAAMADATADAAQPVQNAPAAVTPVLSGVQP